MFYGEYYHSIDRKGRLVLPARFREIAKENLMEKFFLTRGLDKCLFMFSEDEWRTQETKFKSLSFTKTEARQFNRLFFSGAAELSFDLQGRLLIPQYLKDFANIKRDVVVVGVANRIEIWSKELWAEFYRVSQPEFEKISERLLDNL